MGKKLRAVGAESVTEPVVKGEFEGSKSETMPSLKVSLLDGFGLEFESYREPKGLKQSSDLVCSVLDHCSSNLSVHSSHLGILLKCKL